MYIFPGDLWRHCGGLGKEILMPYPINQSWREQIELNWIGARVGLWDTALKFLSPGPRNDVTDHLVIPGITPEFWGHLKIKITTKRTSLPADVLWGLFLFVTHSFLPKWMRDEQKQTPQDVCGEATSAQEEKREERGGRLRPSLACSCAAHFAHQSKWRAYRLWRIHSAHYSRL